MIVKYHTQVAQPEITNVFSVEKSWRLTKLTRAQEILLKHNEGLVKKAVKGAAIGYIGYKIAKPLIPKLASVLKPAIGVAYQKSRDLGYDPALISVYGKDFLNTNVVPYLRNKGVDISGLVNR